MLHIETYYNGVTGICAENSPVTGEFPAQMVSNAENASIWWRHHGLLRTSHCAIQGKRTEKNNE